MSGWSWARTIISSSHFFIRELIARIKIQFREQSSGTRLLKAATLELDRTSCRVRLHGTLLTLTATEFRLLEFLMSRPGVVFSREQLLDAVWGHDRAVTDRTVDVYILRLRQKIESDPANPLFIRSVRGFGYSFNDALVEPVKRVPRCRCSCLAAERSSRVLKLTQSYCNI